MSDNIKTYDVFRVENRNEGIKSYIGEVEAYSEKEAMELAEEGMDLETAAELVRLRSTTHLEVENTSEELESEECFADLDDDDRELLSVYREEINQDGDIEEARDMFAGVYDSPEDWAEMYLGATGALESVPSMLRYHIDFASYAHDCDCEGMSFIRHKGETWVFYNI